MILFYYERPGQALNALFNFSLILNNKIQPQPVCAFYTIQEETAARHKIDAILDCAR